MMTRCKPFCKRIKETTENDQIVNYNEELEKAREEIKLLRQRIMMQEMEAER